MDSGSKSRAEAKLTMEIQSAVRDFISSVEMDGSEVSPVVATAVAAGLPPKMSYTVPEVAKIAGISERTIRRHHENGLIDFIEPDGKRGARVRVSEVERWMNEI